MSNTQSEREMLEQAAKAFGLGDGWVYRAEYGAMVKTEPGFVVCDEDLWNPLANDGDCARMEAALGISVSWKFQDCVYADIEGAEGAWSWVYFKDHSGDKQAARRLASLRVAAEIGRSMK